MKGNKVNRFVAKVDGSSLVVTIGANSGGLKAMTALLHKLPRKTGLAYFYIQSADSVKESAVVLQLSEASSMPVLEARDQLEALPDHLYVIPPQKVVTLKNNVFKVVIPKEPPPSMPLNRFFTNLAENYKESVVGVLLSGDTGDGVEGIRAIKMAGGLTLAQDETAGFKGMPKTAAEEGLIDLVLSPAELAEELGKIGLQRDKYKADLLYESVKDKRIKQLEAELSALQEEMRTIVQEQRKTYQEQETWMEQRTQALIDANIELERSNNELAQFAYVASHDLQEPLRKILTFIDRMQKGHEDDFPPETKKYFSKINEASARMIRLIDDLLNFSRTSRLGKMYVKTDLNSIVQDIIRDLELRIAEKKAIITVDKLPAVEAIPLQMTQLFYNLVSNALKFTIPERTPEIHISCRLLSAHERMAQNEGGSSLFYEIIVKDNGIGFRQEYAEQIFFMFQRLHDRSQYSGTGIGLSLVRKIVNNHNGRIYAIGREHEGAAFHILLPAKQENLL